MRYNHPLTKATMKHNTLIAIAIILFILFIGFFITIGVTYALTSSRSTFTVIGKENTYQGKSTKYLVYNDITTYEISDSIVYMRFDSSDVYGKVTVGKTYEAKLQGFRLPILSMYPNIITLKEIEPLDKSKN